MEQNTALYLPLMEDFSTLQGEGRYTGHAAYFIRLGGCDVGCVWCDVKESWDAAKHPQVALEQIVEKTVASGVQMAVITGGEPLMHNLDQLTATLQERGLRTHVETSGSHALSGNWDWICLSPKKFKAPLDVVVAKADELKVVVYNTSDFAWAETFAARVSSDCLLYLQPEWSKATAITPQIIDYIKSHPRWALSLQTHKYLDIP